MTQVAPHKVRAAEINLLRPSVPEVVDAAMLQEPAHNARDANIIAEPFDQRAQATESSHKQVNLYTSL